MMLRRAVPSLALVCGITAIAAMPARAQWTPQASGTTASLRGLHVVSPTVVWASGSRGTVLRTTDGGTTWRADTVPGAATLDFRGVWAADSLTAFVVSAGQPARIYGTTDGARTWTQLFQHPDTTSFLDGTAFWNRTAGAVYGDPVGGSFVVLTTDDGGRRWTAVPPAALPAPLAGEASFAASNTGIVALAPKHLWFATGGGATARVFHSPDGGRTWSVAATPVIAGAQGAGIFSIAFADARRGVAVGGNYQHPAADSANVALTEDGGRTWTIPAGPRPRGYRSGVAVVPGTKGRMLVAVGTTGSDRSTDGGRSWAAIDSTGYNSVAFASAEAGWAVGDRGRVARWSAGR